MVSKRLQEFVSVVKSEDFVILDSETTGLHNSEVVQIAVINQSGDVLVDTLVKPENNIPWDAIAIHGVDNERVKDAPVWADVWADVHNAIAGRNVIVYNAGFDRSVLYSTTKHADIDRVDWLAAGAWYCAMIAFAEIYGKPNWPGSGWRWQPLSFAVGFFGGEIADAHAALADCRSTLFVTQSIVALPLS